MQNEVNEYLDTFSAAMQCDKISGSKDPKNLKDLGTMKRLSDQLVLIIGKYEVVQRMCFGDHYFSGQS